MNDPSRLTVAGAVELIRERALSPVELTSSLLDRLERDGDPLNCFATVDRDGALAQARALEDELLSGRQARLLHGVPLSVKDNIAVARLPMAAGSPLLAGCVPHREAAVVQRLREAGAIVVAKANLYEFAFGEAHPEFGVTQNPWDETRSCAGSSSGSAAAVATRLGHASVATDTGGSIRVPAAFCGVVGLKPTFDLVSRKGVVPVSHSLDHVGPITRSVEDAALLLAAMTSMPRPVHIDDRGPGGMRLAIPRLPPEEPLMSEVAAALVAAAHTLEAEGAFVAEVTLPDRLVARAVLWTIASVEAAEFHHDFLRSRADEYHPLVRRRLERGEFISAVDYVRAQRVRQKLSLELAEVLRGFDALLLPAVGTTAYQLGARMVDFGDRAEEVSLLVTRFTPLFSLAGWPALVVPWALDSQGLPIGLQVTARPYDEATVFRLGAAIERAAEPLPEPLAAHTPDAST